MSEEAALPGNLGGVTPQGPLNVTAGQLVTFAMNWSDWHDGPFDWAIYIGTISGTISYPPYNVPYPRLVGTTLLASWTNDITFFGNPPTVTGPYLDDASYVASGTLPDYNPKILPDLNPAPFEVQKAWVLVQNTVTITIPTSLAGTYTIRIITGHKGIVPPDPNDVRVLGNPFITLWGWSLQEDPCGYPWGEFVDITTVVCAPAPPTITILSPENKTYSVNILPLTFTVGETTVWMGYSLDSQPNVTITGNTTLTELSDGPHYVVVYANGTFDNMGMSTACFTVDTIPPVADAGPDQTINEDTVVTFDGPASTDENNIATYTWTFTDATPKTLSGKNPTYTFATAGTYTITLEVADPAGNTATDTVTITVLDVTDPVANAGSDRTVNEDISTTLDGSASTDNVGITGYTWTFTDVTVKTLTGDKPAYTFSIPGVYTITLNVTDAAGNWATDTVVITVLDVTNPVANAGQDQTVNVGATVTIDASDSTDNVGIVSYEWNFGDETSGTGKAATHEYTDAGTYTVTLTLEDAAGNQATDTLVVIVNMAEVFPWWLMAAAGIIAVDIVVTAMILWRRRKKRALKNH